MKSRSMIITLIVALLLTGAASALGEVVRLGNYTQIELELEDITVGTDEIEAQIAFMLSLYAQTDADGNRVTPELTDEFAQEHLNSKSAAAYRKRLKKILQEEKREASDKAHKEAYLTELIALSEVTLEEAEVEARTAQYRESLDASRQQLNMDWETFSQTYYGIDLETLEQALRDEAANDLKGEQLLDAVAQDMGVTLDVAEYARRRANFKEQYGLDDARLDALYPEETLRGMLKRDKLWELLLSRD